MVETSNTLRILVDRRPTNLQIEDDGESPYCCDAVLCVEEGSGLVVGADMMNPEKGDGAVVDCVKGILETLREEAPGARVIWVVRQESIAAALAGHVSGSGITRVPSSSFALWDEAYLSMDHQMGSGGAMLPYLWHGDVTPDEVAAFFEAAARLFQAEPWEFLDDTDIMSMASPIEGDAPLIVSAMGSAGISRGIAMFDSQDDHERFMNDEAQTHMVYCSFEDLDHVPHTVAAEAERHGWRTAAADAFPAVVRVKEGEMVPAYGDDLRRVTAALKALGEATADFRKSEG